MVLESLRSNFYANSPWISVLRYQTLFPAIAALSIIAQPAAAHAPEFHQPNQQNQTSSSPSPKNTCTPTQGNPACGSDPKTPDTPQNQSPEPSTNAQPTSNQQIAKSPTAGWGEVILAAIVGTPGLLYWVKYFLY